MAKLTGILNNENLLKVESVSDIDNKQVQSDSQRKSKSNKGLKQTVHNNNINMESETTTSGYIEEDQESRVDKEIKRWAEARKINNAKIRSLTVTTAMETVALAGCEMNITPYINGATNCLGPLEVDVSHLTNYITSHTHLLFGLHRMVLEYPFYRSCFDVCVGIRNAVDPGVLSAFDEYTVVTNYKVRSELFESYKLNLRPRDAVIAHEMIPAVKQHMKLLATDKVIDFLNQGLSSLPDIIDP